MSELSLVRLGEMTLNFFISSVAYECLVHSIHHWYQSRREGNVLVLPADRIASRVSSTCKSRKPRHWTNSNLCTRSVELANRRNMFHGTKTEPLISG
jgi:hypothetical protein